MHRRLDLPDDHLDFDVLFELREHGGTDYLALPIAGVHAVDYMVTSVTDRPGGFAADEIDNLVALLPIGYPLGRFGPVCRIPLADVVYEDYRDL